MSVCYLLRVSKKGSLPRLRPLKLHCLKTSPFPDHPSLLEWLSPFLKPTAAHGSSSRCSTGMALLGCSFSSQRCFCIFTMALLDQRFLCEGRAYLHPDCRRRWDREKSFNPQVSLRQKRGLVFGKMRRGEGAQLLLT